MNIVIAGGGTGGHLFPGIAIAQEFVQQDPGNNITFIGTMKGLESRIIPQLSFRLQTIRVKGFAGKGPGCKLDALLSLPIGFLQSGYHIQRSRADIIVGVGGYISFPAVVAGSALMKPTVIHEQNSIPGLSNRILGRIASRVFVSYEDSLRFFQSHKTMYTGMPIRLQQLAERAPRVPEPFCVCVCGGSQGAHQINRAVCEALPYLYAVKNNIRFMHQSGQSDCDMVKRTYKDNGFTADVRPFVDDIFSWYHQAHLVIGRAGAATLAELALCARAAILIPYPFAADNHQEKNARAFVDTDAALMIRAQDLNGENLAAHIIDLQTHRQKVLRMENQAKTLSRPQAAETIVRECYHLVAQKEQ